MNNSESVDISTDSAIERQFLIAQIEEMRSMQAFALVVWLGLGVVSGLIVGRLLWG